jgi:hypothetical protein
MQIILPASVEETNEERRRHMSRKCRKNVYDKRDGCKKPSHSSEDIEAPASRWRISASFSSS